MQFYSTAHFYPDGRIVWMSEGTRYQSTVAEWAQLINAPEEQAESPLASHIRADFDAASGGHGLAAVWAYMVFLLAYTPCVATVAAQRREIGWKWTLIGFALQLGSAWILAVGVFQVLKVFL